MMPGETHSKPTSIGSEAAGTCQNCTALQQNLNEYVAALIALKQKIIETDHLLREYQQKCDELLFSERENDTLRCQLEQMLQKISPQEQNQEELQSLRAELQEKKSSLKIYQQTQVEYIRVKEECAKRDLGRKKLEAKLKKMEEAAAKHNQDFKQLKMEKKGLERELKKTQEKLNGFPKVKRNKAMKNAQTQIANEETVNVDKRKIKLLLEELWGCVDCSTDKSQNDLKMLEKSGRKGRKQKSSDEGKMPPCHSSPLALGQMLINPAPLPVIQAPCQPNRGKESKANKSFDEAVPDCNGDSAFYEDKTTDLFVPRDLIDSNSECSDIENNESDYFLEILDWAKPLPPLLSPVRFSPSITQEDLFGEYTDSSDEDRGSSTERHSPKILLNGTIESLQSDINRARAPEQTDSVSCLHTPDVFEKVTEIDNGSDCINVNIAVAVPPENVTSKTAACPASENLKQHSMATEMQQNRGAILDDPVALLHSEVMQSEDGACSSNNILTVCKDLNATSVSLCSMDVTSSPLLDTRDCNDESLVLQSKYPANVSDISTDNCESNVTDRFDKPTLTEETCTKISCMTDAEPVLDESFKSLPPEERSIVSTNEFAVQEDVSEEMHVLVQYEDAACAGKDNLDFQDNLQTQLVDPVQSSDTSINHSGLTALESLLQESVESLQPNNISKADGLLEQEKLLAQQHEFIYENNSCVTKHDRRSQDNLPVLPIQSERLATCDETNLLSINVAIHEQLAQKNGNLENTAIKENRLPEHVHFEESEKSVSVVWEEKQVMEEHLSDATVTPASKDIEETSEQLGTCSSLTFSDAHTVKHIDESMEWETTDTKDNLSESGLQLLEQHKSTIPNKWGTSPVISNDAKQQTNINHDQTEKDSEAEKKFASTLILPTDQDYMTRPIISCNTRNINSDIIGHSERRLPLKQEIHSESQLRVLPKSLRVGEEDSLCSSVIGTDIFASLFEIHSGRENEKQDCGKETEKQVPELSNTDQNEETIESLDCSNPTSIDSISIEEQTADICTNLRHESHAEAEVEHLHETDNVVEDEQSDISSTDAAIPRSSRTVCNKLQISPVEGKMNESELLPIQSVTSNRNNTRDSQPVSSNFESMVGSLKNAAKDKSFIPLCDKQPQKNYLHREPKCTAESNILLPCAKGVSARFRETVGKGIYHDTCVSPVADRNSYFCKDSSQIAEDNPNTENEKYPREVADSKDTKADFINNDLREALTQLKVSCTGSNAEGSPDKILHLVPVSTDQFTLKSADKMVNPLKEDNLKLMPVLTQKELQNLEAETSKKGSDVRITEVFGEKHLNMGKSKVPVDSDESEDEFFLRKVNYAKISNSKCLSKSTASISDDCEIPLINTVNNNSTGHLEKERPPKMATFAEVSLDLKNQMPKIEDNQDNVSKSKNMQKDELKCSEFPSAKIQSDGEAQREPDCRLFTERSSPRIISLPEVTVSNCADAENNPVVKNHKTVSVTLVTDHIEEPTYGENTEQHPSDDREKKGCPLQESNGQQVVFSFSDHSQSEQSSSVTKAASSVAQESCRKSLPGKNLIWNFKMSDDFIDPREASVTSEPHKSLFGQCSVNLELNLKKIDGPNNLANAMPNTSAGRRENQPLHNVSRVRTNSQNSQMGQTVLANADTSTKTKYSPETINKVRSEMGPPLPPLLPPLLATPPRSLRPVSPFMSSSSRSSLPSPLDDLISPLRDTPVLPLMSPLSDHLRYKSPLFTTPSPTENTNRRILSSPLQFCAATPKHALPVPGRLPPSAVGSSTPHVQENSVKILDTMYPELSARARTLNILKGNIQLNRCLPGDGKSLPVPISQITGFKAITSTSTAFIKTGSNSNSKMNSSKDKLRDCQSLRPCSNFISENKRGMNSVPMPKSAKRLRMDSESPVTENIKDCFTTPVSRNLDVEIPDESCNTDCDSELPAHIAEGTDANEDAVKNALKKVEALCFDLLPVIRSHVHVGNIPQVPVMRDEEKQVISEFSSVKKDLAEPFLHAILKKLKTEKASLDSKYLQALCRVYVGMCRQLGDLERARLLCYNILKEDYPEPDKLLLFILNTWKDIFSMHGVISKAMQALLKHLAKGDVLTCLSAYLNWEKSPPVSVNIVLSSVLMAIQFCADMKFQPSEQFGEDLTDSIWEYVFAVDLLCCHHKWMWTHDNVISKELWPILDKWVKRKKGYVNIAFIPDMIVATVLRLVGRLCHMGLKEGFVTAVKNISSVIVAFIQHAKEEDMSWSVQLASVYMLCDLAPSDPAVIHETLQAWRRTATNRIPPAVTTGIAEVGSLCAQGNENFI
ncbi:hypothetical protein FKM82_022265 [Ascaphus truei]